MSNTTTGALPQTTTTWNIDPSRQASTSRATEKYRWKAT